MILFAIFKFLLYLGIQISNIIGTLPTPSFDFSWSNDFLNIIDIALFLIPLAKLEPLLITIFIIINLRIVIAVVDEIRKHIPLL